MTGPYRFKCTSFTQDKEVRREIVLSSIELHRLIGGVGDAAALQLANSWNKQAHLDGTKVHHVYTYEGRR